MFFEYFSALAMTESALSKEDFHILHMAELLQ